MGLSDFTDGTDLAVIVAGEPLAHLMYHFRLPYGHEQGLAEGREQGVDQQRALLCRMAAARSRDR